MATLADELLADLMDSGSEGEGDEALNNYLQETNGAVKGNEEHESSADEDEKMDVDQDEEAMLAAAAAGGSTVSEMQDHEEAKAKVEKLNFGAISDIRSVAGLMKTLKPIIEKVRHYQSLPPEKQTKNVGSIEDNPEYRLLTQANALSTSIDNEIILVHKFIRDHYSVRFPELERLVESPVLYAKTVSIIGNGPMEDLKAVVNSSDNPVGVPLSQVLDGPQLMSVRMEATTTQGQSLSDEALQTVIRACEMVLQLDQAKKILTDYVQSRMNMFAPNLTALIGSETAALLVNACGGLKGLAKTPSCNIPNIGWKKQTFGLATNVGVRQKGYLFNSPIVQNIPNDLKTQAMRIVAAKLVLAARCDQVHTTPDGATGEKLKEDCEERLEKLTEAAPNRGVRALPAPDDKPSRKRGGRRARKAKEQYAMTELRKAQNRVQFGKEEQEVGYGTGESTKGLGMVGQAGDGRVRITQVDQRTKAKLSKKNPGWGGATPANGLASSLRGFGQGAAPSVLKNHGLRTTGVGTGTSSVIAFTPIQGLELINPTVKDEMARKRKADEDRWFKSGTFTQVGGSQSQSNGQAEPKVDSAGFKVPAIPAIKRLKAEK